MKTTAKRTIACLSIVLLLGGGLLWLPATYAARAQATETVEPGPEQQGPQDQQGPEEQQEPQVETSPTEEQGEPQLETSPTTETVPETEPVPPEEETESITETETTRTTETTPTLPGSETSLPFTGGRPLGFWLLGALLATIGAATLIVPAVQRRRAARLGKAGPASKAGPTGRAWPRIAAAIALLLAGLALAAYPSVTDLRYFMTQQAMAAEAQGQAMPPGAVARLVIPEIGLDAYVLEGTNSAVLDRAPGHYPRTPLPGESGNSAIAGHRTMFGRPFNRLNELRPGDEILTYTSKGKATYSVVSVVPHSPTDVQVAEPLGDDRLTLTTCHPVGSARQRLVVAAKLVG